MISLFNSFDLNIYSFFPFLYILFSINFLKKFFKRRKMEVLNRKINLNLIKFYYTLKEKNYNKRVIAIVITILISILILNFRRILPFVFPITSQISSVIFLALSIWIRLVRFSIIKSTKNLLAHFTPSGSPYPLIPFLFLIEIVSNIIRPMTVSVRLVSNILAGHLLIILLSKIALKIIPIIVLYSFLNLVEMAVAMIQAYIFCTMLTLYYSDVV